MDAVDRFSDEPANVERKFYDVAEPSGLGHRTSWLAKMRSMFNSIGKAFKILPWPWSPPRLQSSSQL